MAIDLQWLQDQFPDISKLNPLSDGGQKEVFSGIHDGDGTVVLKIYHPKSDYDRILRELEAVKNINSPRVPRVFEMGNKHSPVGEIVWIREELIPGRNLRQVLETEQTLTLKATMKLGMHMLEALADAEKERIVHRDVKPENIIIDTDGDAWLLDFGLARHLDLSSLTATADCFAACTPGYAPPEQFLNQKKDIDSRADLFALGVTLYECVEGINPFRASAQNVEEILRQVIHKPLQPVSEQIDKKREFSGLVEVMTRPKPNHRISTVAEALTWMREICREEELVW